MLAVLIWGAPVRANEATLTFAGGLSIPRCAGQAAPCDGSIDPGPSLEATAVEQATRTLGWGLIARVSRVHWRATYPGQIQGAPPGTVEAPLTTGFLGLGVRFKWRSDATVNPIVQGTAGLAIQAPTPSVPSCGGYRVAPAARIGAGVSVRASQRISWFVLGDASLAWPLDGCDVSDGPPPAPLAAAGFALEAGIAFDVAYAQAPRN